MDRAIVVALVVALVSGMTIGIQSSLLPWAQRLLGAATTGMLVNVAGGTLSLGILLLLALRGTGAPIAAVREGMPYWGLAGALGVGIMVGLSFALPRAGVAAGLAGVIVGQMLMAVLLDTTGLSGSKIPLTAARITGLLLLIIAVWLLAPKR